MSIVKEEDIEQIKYGMYLKSSYVAPIKKKTKTNRNSTYRINGVEVSKSAFDLHVKELRAKGIRI